MQESNVRWTNEKAKKHEPVREKLQEQKEDERRNSEANSQLSNKKE